MDKHEKHYHTISAWFSAGISLCLTGILLNIMHAAGAPLWAMVTYGLCTFLSFSTLLWCLMADDKVVMEALPHE